MTNRFKVAALQMDCVQFDVERNLRAAERLLESAKEAGVALAVLPELFNTGYRVEERDAELAEPIPGPTTDRLTRFCEKNGMFVAASIIERTAGEKREDALFDTAFLTGPKGVVGTYRKNFLWGGESDRFGKGDSYGVFDIGFCKVGLQICYEIGFPEGARILALMGADVLLYPSAFGAARRYAWDLASRARALENGLYVVACNRAGTEKNETVFAGNSRIVDPRGDILVAAVENYAVISAEVDLTMASQQRNAIPYLRDLRRELIADYYKRGEQ